MTDEEFILKVKEIFNNLDVQVQVCNTPDTLYLGSFSYMRRFQLLALAKGILELEGYKIIQGATEQDTKRVAELITEFSRCRQGRKVKDCEECGLLYHNFADCPLKPQHDEYSGFEMSGFIDIKEAEALLPDDVREEFKH